VITLSPKIAWASDSSAVLVPDDLGVNLIEIGKENITRVTNLQTECKRLLLADYRACDPASAGEGEPPFVVDFRNYPPRFDDNDHVVIECDGYVSPTEQAPERKHWLARLDAIWNVKDARFVKQKVVRGRCEKLAEKPQP
jgi:hypothetical protein